MSLTPLDVRRKQFEKAFRGYDPAAVDGYLKQVAERLEAVQDEARRAEERVREMEGKLSHYEKVELALQEALESARETARRSEASAEERARLLIDEAELRAEKILHDAERERHGLRQDLVRLNARQTEVAARLRGFLLSELEVLAQFQGDEPVGFLKLQPADTPSLGGGPSHAERASLPTARADAPAPAPSPEDTVAPEAAQTEPAAPPAEPPSWQAPPFVARPAGDLASVQPLSRPSAPAEAPALSPADAFEPEPSPAESRPPEPRAAEPSPSAGGWDLRSLVTGGRSGVAASGEEADRIRRILDDLD